MYYATATQLTHVTEQLTRICFCVQTFICKQCTFIRLYSSPVTVWAYRNCGIGTGLKKAARSILGECAAIYA